jgi:hypothetical protein
MTVASNRGRVWTMAAIKEHERVVLTTTLPSERLEAGDVGTVVHVYRDGARSKSSSRPSTAEPQQS